MSNVSQSHNKDHMCLKPGILIFVEVGQITSKGGQNNNKNKVI